MPKCYRDKTTYEHYCENLEHRPRYALKVVRGLLGRRYLCLDCYKRVVERFREGLGNANKTLLDAQI